MAATFIAADREALAEHDGIVTIGLGWRIYAGSHQTTGTKLPRQETKRMAARTLYEKIWDAHVVREEPGQPTLIYIDRHLIHEGTSPQAFAGLKAAGRKVRRPELTFAVMDHSVSTKNRLLPVVDADARGQF